MSYQFRDALPCWTAQAFDKSDHPKARGHSRVTTRPAHHAQIVGASGLKRRTAIHGLLPAYRRVGRRALTELRRALAAEFGVSRNTIARVVGGVSYRHVILPD
ncbi:hypothetical protein GCM10023317_27740 [Actinopolymorpha pittospori]